jgi:hypothetical protein
MVLVEIYGSSSPVPTNLEDEYYGFVLEHILCCSSTRDVLVGYILLEISLRFGSMKAHPLVYYSKFSQAWTDQEQALLGRDIAAEHAGQE